MISRNEYMYMKSRIGDLTMWLAEFEIRSDIYHMFKKWESMHPDEQSKLIAAWDTYYQNCREGYYGKKYLEALECSKMHAKTHDGKWKERLDAIVREVTDAKEPFLKKPSTIDPRDFPNKLHGYYEVKRQLSEYQDTVDEYAPVYETKREATSL